MENHCSAKALRVDSIPHWPKGRNPVLTPGTPFSASYGHLSPKLWWAFGPIFCKTSPESSDVIKSNKYQMIKPLMTHMYPAGFNLCTGRWYLKSAEMEIQVSSKSIRSDWKMLWSKYVFKKVTAGVIILARLSMHSAVCFRLPRTEVHSECWRVTFFKKRFFKSSDGHQKKLACRK